MKWVHAYILLSRYYSINQVQFHYGTPVTHERMLQIAYGTHVCNEFFLKDRNVNSKVNIQENGQRAMDKGRWD